MSFLAGLAAVCTTVFKAVNIVATTISAVTTAITIISKALGLTKTENPEELGEKALQAEEQNIRPENFKTYEEYVKEVESMNLDPERSSKWTKEQKEAKAFELGTMLLTEKFGPNANTIIIDIAKRPEFFTPERAKHYLEVGQEQNIDLSKISDVLNNKTSDFDSVVEGKDLMFEIEKSLNPNLTPQEHSEKVMAMRAE